MCVKTAPQFASAANDINVNDDTLSTQIFTSRINSSIISCWAIIGPFSRILRRQTSH